MNQESLSRGMDLTPLHTKNTVVVQLVVEHIPEQYLVMGVVNQSLAIMSKLGRQAIASAISAIC